MSSPSEPPKSPQSPQSPQSPPPAKPLATVVSLDPERGLAAHDGADGRLAALGYQAEMKRSLGLLSTAGLGAAIIAAPFGLSTSSLYALTNGGTPTYIWGWLLMSFLSLCLASSLGEIASKYPVAGGPYIWVSALAPKGSRAMASFVVGWISAIANLTLCLSICFGEAQLILAAVSLWREQVYVPTAWQTVLMFWAITLFSALVNAGGVRFNYLERLNTASIYWSALSSVIILIVLLAMTPTYRSARDVFVTFTNSSGWPDGWSFFIGLLTAAYTLTGYGTIAQLSEEVHEPERAIPRAMVGCVVVASLTGFAYIIPVSFVMPDDISGILTAASGPLPAVLANASGRAGGIGLLVLILGIGMFASIGSMTVAIRSVWSFARDDGLPGSKWLKKVSLKHELPINSLLASTLIICLLGLIYLGASAAFLAFTGSCTILLALSYILPVGCSMLQGRRQVRTAPWSMGPVLGWTSNLIALAWVTLSVVLFCFPSTSTVTLSTMNWSSAVVVGFALLASAYYVLGANKLYKGPMGLDEVDDVDDVRPLPEMAVAGAVHQQGSLDEKA